MALKRIQGTTLLLLVLYMGLGCGRRVQYDKDTDNQDDSAKKEVAEVIGAFLLPSLIEPDSVVINLFAYSERYSEVELVLSKESHNIIRFLPNSICEEPLSVIKGEDINIYSTLIDSIFELGELLLVKKTLPVYSYREHADSVGPFHEGPILSVRRYKNGVKTDTEHIYLEDVFTSRIRYTEDCYAIVYSRQFRFLIQFLYYAQAIASEQKEEYEKDLERLQRNSDYYPGLEILIPPVISEEGSCNPLFNH